LLLQDFKQRLHFLLYVSYGSTPVDYLWQSLKSSQFTPENKIEAGFGSFTAKIYLIIFILDNRK